MSHIFFRSCLIVFLHALSGAGYVDVDPALTVDVLGNKTGSNNISTLSRWRTYAQSNIGSQWTRLKAYAYDDFSSTSIWHCEPDGDVDADGVQSSLCKLCLADRFGPIMRGTARARRAVLGNPTVEREPRNYEFTTRPLLQAPQKMTPGTSDVDEPKATEPPTLV